MSTHKLVERLVTEPTDLAGRCDRLRSLHVPGTPLVLPNAWDVASARAVVAAGFPVVATTSMGVAASLGYEDHERAPSEEMLAAAGRIAGAVEVPVTVDAEAGYGIEPADLVAALRTMGAAGCNLEDTNHAGGELRDPVDHAAWLRAVRDAASEQSYALVINARIDVFVAALTSGSDASQAELVGEALRRAHAYTEAGVDCVFPIGLWERDALAAFVSQAPGPVNVLRIPPAPPLAELAELGVARVSYGGLLHRDAIEQFSRLVESVPAAPADE
jgi:2-methylisocitrate lyase-like PEP mutase family enzyme